MRWREVRHLEETFELAGRLMALMAIMRRAVPITWTAWRRKGRNGSCSHLIHGTVEI